MTEKRIHVLILDDDPDDAMLLEDHFEDLPPELYSVDIASTWETASQKLREQSFDILLCDYRLGAISGLQVIQTIRAEGISLPVVLLTGVGTKELDERALDAGASDFLAKDELSPALVDRTIRYAIAAHERQHLLQTVLDCSGAAVMLLNADDEIVLSNAVAKEIGDDLIAYDGSSGVSVEELANRTLATPDDEIRLGGRVLDRSTTQFDTGQKLLVLQDVTDRARVLEERERSSRRMAHAARHDALTGLGNRLAFSEAMSEWIGRAKMTGERFALFSFDLDRFKDVNDIYGHAMGDELLSVVAQRLRETVNNGAFLARLGGDEFVVLMKLYRWGSEEALDSAQTILHALSQRYEMAGKSLHCSGSVGIAVFPDHGMDSDTLTANADLAMYRAKATPNQSFSFFDEQMDAAVRSDRALVEELREVIDRDELDIFIQPQTTVSDRRVVGFEALARWFTPDGGTVPPDRFIKVAERSGLILPLGEHLLNRSLMAASKWKTQAKIAINVSPVQVNHCDLPGILRQALVDHGMSPSQVEIEITETALLEHTERALHALRQVRAMGVSIALDDFGTGYSSLAMLQSFPFDKVKIDRSFVMDLERHGNAAIVRSIAQLGENLGIRVLCEGVETERHAVMLNELGCDEMQGYLLARPFPASNADAWSTAQRGHTERVVA